MATDGASEPVRQLSEYLSPEGDGVVVGVAVLVGEGLGLAETDLVGVGDFVVEA
jgi:hypothetical protein